MRLKLSKKMQDYWLNDTQYYSMQSTQKFLNYFFFNNKNIKLVNDDLYDAMMFDIQDVTEIETMHNNKKNRKINILVCVENCACRGDLKHYKLYENYGNSAIDIYMYNHISTCESNDVFITIPIIILQMEYFRLNFSLIKPSNFIPFEQKKFCLITTSPHSTADMESAKRKIMLITHLQNIGICDDIKDFKFIIKNKSCYHSQELLDLYSQYKFVFACENSVTNGYITEKIFNVFFARTIPIYFGANNILNYFNTNSFVNFNNIDSESGISNTLKKIMLLNGNKNLYENMIGQPICSKIYDDQKCKDILQNKLFNI